MLSYLRTLIFILLSLLLLASCASNPSPTATEQANEQTVDVTSEEAQFSGFLSDYTRLTPDADSSALSWVDASADIAAYDKILLERIRVSLQDQADYKAIDPTELKALADYFHEALVREFGDAYPIVVEPGPGVLRARIAITNLVPTEAEMSVVALVVPFATIADLGAGVAAGREAGSTAYVGETGIEAEFLDSESNQVIAQYVDNEVGKKYVVDTSDGLGEAISKGFSQYGKAYTTWGYAQQAFDTWAKLFRQSFDELRSR